MTSCSKALANTDTLLRTCWTLAGHLGRIQVECTARGVARLRFLGTQDETPVGAPDAGFQHEHPWVRQVHERLQAYLDGERVTLHDLPVDLTGQPSFRRMVQEACRRIGYGETMSYAALAACVGQPNAARAVGSAMSHNPVGLLIPCHRVLCSDGSLGGFSAPDGTRLKQKLLDIEKTNCSQADGARGEH